MIKFHLGTVALGSFLISFIQMLRTVLRGSDVSLNDFSVPKRKNFTLKFKCLVFVFIQLNSGVARKVRNVKQQLVTAAWAAVKVTCNTSIEMHT